MCLRPYLLWRRRLRPQSDLFLSLIPIDNTSTNVTKPSSSFHGLERVSPTTTETAYDINDIEHLPEEHMESFRAVGIKVREHRDFAFEPMPNSSNASENFDLVLCLIGTDWHMRMRNSRKNYVMQYTRLSFVSSR